MSVPIHCLTPDHYHENIDHMSRRGLLARVGVWLAVVRGRLARGSGRRLNRRSPAEQARRARLFLAAGSFRRVA